METITFDHDITVLYVTAASFPDGVMDAFNRLYAMIPYTTGRRFFGISRPEHGVITYRAGAEELHAGEAEILGCATLLLKQGIYTGVIIKDFMSNIPAISAAFRQLLALPGIDPEGYCVEWYQTQQDVTCMIRMQ